MENYPCYSLSGVLTYDWLSIWNTIKILICPENGIVQFYNEVLHPKYADGIGNHDDPDQTAVWSRAVLFFPDLSLPIFMIFSESISTEFNKWGCISPLCKHVVHMCFISHTYAELIIYLHPLNLQVPKTGRFCYVPRMWFLQTYVTEFTPIYTYPSSLFASLTKSWACTWTPERYNYSGKGWGWVGCPSQKITQNM